MIKHECYNKCVIRRSPAYHTFLIAWQSISSPQKFDPLSSPGFLPPVMPPRGLRRVRRTKRDLEAEEKRTLKRLKLLDRCQPSRCVYRLWRPRGGSVTVAQGAPCCKHKCSVDDTGDDDLGFHYDAELVAQCRKYYLDLGQADKARFALERYVAPCGERQRGTYFLEDPEALASRLQHIAASTSTSSRLPPPAMTQDQCVPVCANFFRFVVGLSYEQHIPKKMPSGTGHSNPRGSPKADGVYKWFDEQKEAHLIMPNADFTVLPWVGVCEVHAAMVEQMEDVHPHATWAKEAARRPEDLDLPDPDEHHDILDPDQVAGVKDKDTRGFRYGNPLVGKKGTFPELDTIASLSWMRKLWRRDEKCRKCVIRKWMPFAKCTTCCTLREKLQETIDPKTRRELQKKHKDHVLEMMKERSKYWTMREMALRYPKRLLSVIIDGADNGEHALPHFGRKSKASSEAFKSKLHVIGVIAHHRDSYVYTCPGHVKQGHNVTIQALWETIDDIKQKQGELPDNLHVQLDNTTKQNKGRFLAAFCEALAEMGVFKRVYFSYLPVGHTHEDIDQMFSRFSIRLRKHNALSRQGFAKQIQRSFTKYNKHPIVVHWDAIGNFSGWLEAPGRIKTTAQTAGWMKFRSFRFMKHGDGIAAMQARYNMRDPVDGEYDPWGGFDEGQPYLKLLNVPAVELFAAMRSGNMPPAQRTECNEEYMGKREAGLRELAEVYGSDFPDADQNDCFTMLFLECGNDDIPWSDHMDLAAVDRIVGPLGPSPAAASAVPSKSSAPPSRSPPVPAPGPAAASPLSSSSVPPSEPSVALRAPAAGSPRSPSSVPPSEPSVALRAPAAAPDPPSDDADDAPDSDDNVTPPLADKYIKEMKPGDVWLLRSDDDAPFWVGEVRKVTPVGARIQYWVPNHDKKNQALLKNYSINSAEYHAECARDAEHRLRDQDGYALARWSDGWLEHLAQGFVAVNNSTKRLRMRDWKKAINWAKAEAAADSDIED